MRKIFFILFVIVLSSFSEISLKKKISDASFRYEFFTTDAEVYSKSGRQYYWFKGGTIHNSEYGVAGELLHGEFQKFYHSNQLAESGKFDEGLKAGFWKTWYTDGTLASYVYWSKGQMDGTYKLYDKLGVPLETGKYSKNRKHGTWINHSAKDTLRYRNGQVVLPRVKDTIQKNDKGFIKRLFSKKEATIAPEPQKKSGDNFFKRLFAKKDKGVNTNQEKPTKKAQHTQPSADGATQKKPGFFARLFGGKSAKNGKGK